MCHFLTQHNCVTTSKKIFFYIFLINVLTDREMSLKICENQNELNSNIIHLMFISTILSYTVKMGGMSNFACRHLFFMYFSSFVLRCIDSGVYLSEKNICGWLCFTWNISWFRLWTSKSKICYFQRVSIKHVCTYNFWQQFLLKFRLRNLNFDFGELTS